MAEVAEARAILVRMASFAGPPSAEWSRAAREPSGFTRYFRTVREHIRLITACTLLTAAAAIAYVEVAPRTYTAEAQLLINPAAQQDTVLFSLPVLHATGDPVQDVLTASALVTTPQVADSVIAALHLDMTAPDLLGKIQSTPLAQSNIIALQATSSSATGAKRLANAFAVAAIAVRTTALHRAIALQLPGLRAGVAALPPAVRNGPGTLGDQLVQLEALQGAPDPTISVAAPATLPSAPTSPRRNLSLAAGLFAGLLLGIGAAFAFDALDPRVRREDQLRERFGEIPVMARIPRVGRRRRSGRLTRRRRSGPLTPLELSGSALEQYRTLRATLGAHASGEPQAYLITGSAPSEGKTTSAINLASVLAQSGNDVILLEADLRRPMIAQSLGLTTYYGTEQVLDDEVSLAEALIPIRLGATSIRVLAAHPHSAEMADRLSLVAARRLVNEAKSQADFIVIDSPPLTAVTDALPVTQVVDEVVVVARIGHTRLSKLSDLWELLAHQGRLPSGIVLIGGAEQDGYGYEYQLKPEEQAWPAPSLSDPEPDREPSASRRIRSRANKA